MSDAVGSTPTLGTRRKDNHVRVGESRVPATPSRWRPRVQIPSGTLCGPVRKPAKRPSSNLGGLRVRLSPGPLTLCVGWALAGPDGCNPSAKALQVRLLPDTL